MKRELKPCPFCGSQDELQTMKDSGCWRVSCLSCCADGPWGYDADAAIDKWNTRAPLDKEEG